MPKQNIERIIELSNKLIGAIKSVALNNDDEKLPPLLADLASQRAIAIKALFSEHSDRELQQHSALLQQVVDLDSALQQISNTKKNTLAKAIIQQKKNTKATKAYLGS